MLKIKWDGAEESQRLIISIQLIAKNVEYGLKSADRSDGIRLLVDKYYLKTILVRVRNIQIVD